MGPASGCPWLADARKSPLFDGVDAPAVQWKGCTFCLDQTGAYAAPSEAQVLDAWLPQLRALRARDPSVREVLLIDERPHMFLPAFFDSVAKEPALAGIELLVKSRVDWLLEYGESHLARAAEAAARSGSVLHVYLVGFENFDAFHLQLFNKGQTAEDSQAALEMLRALGRRFPGSFEFRRLRAHGFVLFTPWTTPEALVTNARWMARLGFDEVRSDALKTRLRLYPRTPLYHLAERDGLLTERFEDARPDRAAEQGYDASMPWRFRDARTEAVFRICTALYATGDSAPGEADVLQVAAELLLEYPGLAGVASEAHLPLLRTPRARGWRLLRGLGLLGFDLELERIRRGKKAAALKESVPAAEVDGLLRAYRAMGFCADVVTWHGVDTLSGTHVAGHDYAGVAVAATPEALSRTLDLRRAIATSFRREDVAPLGELMGYPSCCSAAFAQLPEHGDNADLFRQALLQAAAVPLEPLLNRFGPFDLLSHFICGPACAPSLELAREALEWVRAKSPDAARIIEQALARPVLFLDLQRVIDLEGRFESRDFVVERLDVAGARLLGLPEGDAARGARLSLSPGGVEVSFARRESFISAERPMLVVPGQPLAEVVREAGTMPPPAKVKDTLPALPPAIRPGVRVGAYRLSRVSRDLNAWVLLLTREGDELAVRLTTRSPGDDGPSAGPFRFHFDLATLGPEGRAALTLIARVIADPSSQPR
jgi:hypothetical protein